MQQIQNLRDKENIKLIIGTCRILGFMALIISVEIGASILAVIEAVILFNKELQEINE